MADINANIGIEVDASNAISQLKSLQRQISQFHTSIAKSSESAALAQRSLQKNLINSINSLGAFSAEMRTVRTTAESFTNSLEKNKFSMGQYFKFAAASTKTFGRLFTSEFDTITKVAEDRVKKMQTQYIKMGRDASGAMKAIAVIPNELDMSKLNTQMQMAAQRQALFNQLIKQGSTNLLNFGKNTQWAGRQLMVGFTLPLVTLGSTASRVFMEMETAALKFKKVYGDLFTPKEETQQALESVKELGREFTKYGIAVADTVKVAADAAAAGFQGLDLQRQVTQATRLQILGQVEQQKALETTISLQNAFRMSSEDLSGAINFLNAVENQTVVSLDDITTAIPKAAPIIQELGGDVKDLAFFMAAMKEGGINASEGANALKSGLASLINPTQKAKDMMRGFGIDIDAIVNKNAGNVKQTVIEFAQSLDGLTDLNRQRAIEQLFGKFQQARLSALFDNVIRGGNQAARVLDLAGASTADLAALAESELGITAESSMNKFRKSVEDLKFALAPVGEEFLKAATPIVEFATKMLDKFNNLGDGTKKLITILTIGIGGVGPILLMTFGLLANGLANIIKLGLLLRKGYLKITGQSALLAESTQYLTDEQLQATAAAASLEQAHANITQQFLLEDQALKDLVVTYQRAIDASQKFALANPGMILPTRPGRRPVRRAGGGEVSGPGTSTSDSIPALLSNGEYVINASAVKQYGPGFLDAINAKRFSKGGMVLPGFSRGGEVLTPVQKGHIVTDERGYMMMMEGWLNQIIRSNSSGATGSTIAKGLSRTESRTGFHPVSLLASMIEDMQKSGFTFSGDAKSASKKLYDGILRKLRTSYSDTTLGGRGNLSLEKMITDEILLDPNNPLSKIMVTSPGGSTASLHDVLMSPTTVRDKTGSAKSRGWGFFSGNKTAVTPAEKILQEFTGGVGRGTSAAGYFTTSRTLSKRQLLSMLSFGKFGNTISKLGIKSKNLTSIFSQMKNNKGRGFLGAISSIFKNGVKANKGMFNVPGKGNKDIVPAMLTPGEAVIPKEQNKKYAGLVQGIIADNIPGFVRGTPKVRKSGAASRRGKALSGVPAMRGINSANPQGLLNFGDVDPNDMFAVTSLGLEDIVQRENISMAKVDKEFADWSKNHKELIKNASDRVAQGTSIEEAYKDVSEKFNKDMDELGGETAKLRKAAKKHYPRLRKDLVQAQEHAKKLGLNLRDARDNSRLVADLPQNAVAQGLGNTRGNYQTRGGLRGVISSMFGSASFARSGIPRKFIDPSRLDELKQYELSLEHVNTTEKQLEKRSKKQIAAAKKLNANVPKDLASQSRRALYGTGPVDAEAKSVRRQQERLARRAEREARAQQRLDKKIAESKMRLYGHTEEVTAIERARRKQAEKNQRDLDRVEKERIKAEIDATEDVKSRTKTSGRGKKIGRIAGGALAGGTMAAAMLAPQGSKLSEIANMAYIPLMIAQLFQNPLVKAGKKVIEFSAKIGLTARKLTVIGAALTAGIFLWKKYSESQENNRKKLEAFSDAVTTTEDQASFIKNTFGVNLKKSALQMAKPGTAPTYVQRRTELEAIKSDKKFQEAYGNTIDAIKGMSPQQAVRALRFKGFELLSQGMAPEQVQLLIDAIKEEAGKQSLVLNFSEVKLGPNAFKQMNKDISALLKDFDKQYEKGVTRIPIYENAPLTPGPRSGGSRAQPRQIGETKKLSKEFKAYLKNIGTAAGTQMNIISNAFNNGIIDAKQFNTAVKDMFATFKKDAPDAAAQSLLIKAALEQVNPELAKSVTKIKDLSDKYLVLQAAMMGVVATVEQLKILQSPDTPLSSITNDGERNVAGSMQANKASVRGNLIKEMEAQQKRIQDYIKSLNQGSPDGNKDKEKTLIQLIKEKTKALVTQVQAFKALRLAGIEASVAAEFASDPQFAEKIAAAAKKGGAAWKAATAEIKEYAKQQKLVEKMLIAGADQGDYELARLQMAQKYIELQEHLIDMQNAPTLKNYNDELVRQEESLDKINQKIDDIAINEIAPLQRLISANEYALSKIEVQEDAINEKYDKQINALETIAKINQDIAAIQKGRLDLAEALSRGDISAAAGAIIEMRSQQAARQSTAQTDALEAARQQELSALGRNALEKQNRDLQLQIAGIEQTRLVNLETEKQLIESKITSINRNIDALNKQIDAQKSILSYFGMTKDQIDMAVKALDLAKNAGIDINDPAFLNNILKGAKGDADSLKLALDAVAIAARAALAELQALRAAQFGGGTMTPGTGTTDQSILNNYPDQRKEAIDSMREITDFFASQAASANTIKYALSGNGRVGELASGGLVPKYFSKGGFSRGTDTVPAMLTPGEFVVRKSAVDSIGLGSLNKINNGSYLGSPVYNYDLTVNLNGANMNADDVAETVIRKIKQIDSQKIRRQMV